MKVEAWVVTEPGRAMTLERREERPGPGQVLVSVAGCGVCHTDLGFFYDGVPTRHPLPLALGHEVSGRVVEAGPGAEAWLGRAVVVPAVIPCGDCDACRAGRGSICPRQIFPGNDVHGGFASHLVVPAHGLCPVPDLADASKNPAGIDLPTLSVIADAVSTPYQAILRSDLQRGDLAVFVGAGGVGGFGVQIAAALGAHVVAIDVDPARLATLTEHGAHLALDAKAKDARALKSDVKAFAKQHGVPTWRWRIFETSGTTAGQESAFALLGHGSWLSLVGFTPQKATVRLSNLMALDATAQGNWGCLPEHYPAVLDLVLSGKVALEPFTEHRPLSSINDTFADVHAHKVTRRVVLVPEA
ncbi:MAG: 6-hydroxycyclohex-1-ene-1-carbonyl-CoA dehydrogenase [Planctomycetes bacterium]|nr:6-hydroxycyclohex-1-ene-1-carbonyl-CoA dehydrogenase [Planctomycetota bacterium]